MINVFAGIFLTYNTVYSKNEQNIIKRFYKIDFKGFLSNNHHCWISLQHEQIN